MTVVVDAAKFVAWMAFFAVTGVAMVGVDVAWKTDRVVRLRRGAKTAALAVIGAAWIVCIMVAERLGRRA